MKTNDIRKKFLDFFASKNHAVIESDSLVPKNDPTVLFTTAGMQQFKEQFLGHIDDFTRAATSQKCLRTDDLDEVGETDFHHTFFEMLGNFSFGDYFKKEAIEWAWEFLITGLNIPKDKLWVSVYKDDKESEGIWLNEIKIKKERLVRLGDKSNFWPANAKENGPNGPCGPCSEIFFDYGKNPDCKSSICDPSCNCGRFSEIWNLVFTQFNRKDEGVLEPLPNKNIDTGMGLERLCAVMQGKKNNFETDLFTPIIKAIEDISKKESFKLSLKETRVIADHIRAITFAINDGVIPSNKERGYVVKGLINKSSNIVLQNGADKPIIYKLVDSVIEAMNAKYPDLEKNKNDIKNSIKNTEKAFIIVRKQRIPELIQAAKEKEAKLNNKPDDKSRDEIIAEIGDMFYFFHDTCGLPLSTITATTANTTSISQVYIDQGVKSYEKLMNEQKERSRQSSKMAGDVFSNDQLQLNEPKTKFFGYEQLTSTSTVLAIFIENNRTPEAKEGDIIKIVLDKTPFYAESGGQIGDTGYINSKNARVRITDTQKISDIFIHIGIIEQGSLIVNDQVIAEVNPERRLSIMRNHTSTHLLQSALREVLGQHVQQQGSYVSDEQLRFDFTHHKAVSDDEINKIEKRVNKLILNCDTVTKEFLNIKAAKEKGALAFFAEKYSDTVRIISVGDYSKEFCGGTHLESTGQIGLFKIISESAIAQGIRRIEARTGMNAINYIKDKDKQLEEISKILKSPLSDVVNKTLSLTKKIKELQKDLEKYQFEAIKGSVDSILSNSQIFNGSKIISHYFKDTNIDILKRVSELIKTKEKSSVITLGTKSEDSASITVSVSDDLVKKGIKANEIIKKIAHVLGGNGGGRPEFAQAGSKETEKVEAAVKMSADLIKESMKA